MKKLIVPVLFLASSLAARSQTPDPVLKAFEKHSYKRGKDSLPYRLLLPLDYDPAKKYPLVIFLHGAGERGNENERQLTHGAKLFLRDSIRKKYPAIVVFPQCPWESYWSNARIVADETGKRNFFYRADGDPTAAMMLLKGLYRDDLSKYAVDENRVYIAGLSMGAMGTFEFVRRNPKVFAAAIAICGGAEPSTASVMTATKWWIFHGEKDNIVNPQFSERMVTPLKESGASVKYTTYPNVDHNSWDNAFAEPAFLHWLFNQKK